MDILTSILQAPINTILIFAGIAFVFLALFEVSKGTVKLRNDKTNYVPIAIGAVLLLGGIFYRTGSAPSAQPTQEPVEATATLVTVSASDTPSPTQALVPTASPTDAPQPTATTQIRTLVDGCFDTQTWKPHSINEDTLNAIISTDNCFNLNTLGISVEKGGTLHLLATAPKTDMASGISMPISDQSAIEFKFSVKSLYIVYPNASAYITFSIAPAENPMAEAGSGRFKLLVDKTGDASTVYYYLANLDQTVGSRFVSQHPSYNRTYTVRLELKGLSMEIYINGAQLQEEVTVPAGSKVLYIGYNLPVQAGVEVEITDLTVNRSNP